MSLSIDIRHRALRGGRLHIRSGTSSSRTRDRYKADLYQLIEDGHLDLIDRVRDGSLSLPEIRQAVRVGDVSALRTVEAQPPLTVGEAVDRVLGVVEAAGVPGTTKLYQSATNLLLETFERERDIATITSDDARDFLQQSRPRRGKSELTPWSPGRQSVVRSVIGRIWNDEIRREAELSKYGPRLTASPWGVVKLPKVRPTRFAFLRPEEWRTLYGKVRGKPVAALLALGCLAGLRQQEVAHLRPGTDVDMDEGFIRVQAREGKHKWRPKTERGERRVPIGRQLRNVLEDHARFAGQRYLVVQPYRDRPLAHSTIEAWTRKAYESVGLRYGQTGDALTFHSLRHTFASWLVQRDVSPLKVADLIGDTPEMVMRVYGHLGKRDLIQTISLLDLIVLGEA